MQLLTGFICKPCLRRSVRYGRVATATQLCHICVDATEAFVHAAAVPATIRTAQSATAPPVLANVSAGRYMWDALPNTDCAHAHSRCLCHPHQRPDLCQNCTSCKIHKVPKKSRWQERLTQIQQNQVGKALSNCPVGMWRGVACGCIMHSDEAEAAAEMPATAGALGLTIQAPDSPRLASQ